MGSRLFHRFSYDLMFIVWCLLIHVGGPRHQKSSFSEGLSAGLLFYGLQKDHCTQIVDGSTCCSAAAQLRTMTEPPRQRQVSLLKWRASPFQATTITANAELLGCFTPFKMILESAFEYNAFQSSAVLSQELNIEPMLRSSAL